LAAARCRARRVGYHSGRATSKTVPASIILDEREARDGATRCRPLREASSFTNAQVATAASSFCARRTVASALSPVAKQIVDDEDARAAHQGVFVDLEAGAAVLEVVGFADRVKGQLARLGAVVSPTPSP